EATGTQQRRIQYVRTVGGGDHDHAVIAFEAVHFNQQLVQRLFAFVMATADTGATMATHGVDLVDEDDAGGLLLGGVEHVTHARGTNTDEHLDEVGTGNREEEYLGLAGNRLGEQRLAGTGLADHQHTARDTAAQALVLVGVAQEVDEFLHVFLGFIHARHVGEGDLDLVLAEHLGLALAEGHRAALAAHAAALHLAHEEHEQRNDDQDREGRDQQLAPDALALRLSPLDRHVVGQEVVHQLRIFDVGADGVEHLAITATADDVQPADGDFIHLARLNLPDEIGVVQLLGGAGLAEILENHQQDSRDDHPQQQVFYHVIQCLILTGRLPALLGTAGEWPSFWHEYRQLPNPEPPLRTGSRATGLRGIRKEYWAEQAICKPETTALRYNRADRKS